MKNKNRTTKGSLPEANLSAAVKHLKRRRQELIEAEIKVERGFMGRLRRLGFPWVKVREAIPAYAKHHELYIEALDEFRRAFIAKKEEDTRMLFSAKIPTIYMATVMDEIERVKMEKEILLRQQGIRGVVREKADEYRELAPTLKMSFGIFFLLLGAVFFIFSIATDYVPLQFVFISFGLMLFLEGLQQDVSIWEAVNLGLTRGQIYRAAERRISAEEPEAVANQLKQIHLDLETQIWRIRQFEKRSEYSRYLIASLGGALIGFFLAYLQGPILAFDSLALAILSRFFWFILPFGIIQLVILERDKYYSAAKYPKELELIELKTKS